MGYSPKAKTFQEHSVRECSVCRLPLGRQLLLQLKRHAHPHSPSRIWVQWRGQQRLLGTIGIAAAAAVAVAVAASAASASAAVVAVAVAFADVADVAVVAVAAVVVACAAAAAVAVAAASVVVAS